jgi:uncharacterized membrane protein AbrB (regulator of aidB expression)
LLSAIAHPAPMFVLGMLSTAVVSSFITHQHDPFLYSAIVGYTAGIVLTRSVFPYRSKVSP